MPSEISKPWEPWLVLNEGNIHNPGIVSVSYKLIPRTQPKALSNNSKGLRCLRKQSSGCKSAEGWDGSMVGRRKPLLLTIYVLATVQFAWCYLWLTRPYVSTALYERGMERMPFQGRCLMMLPMDLANSSAMLRWVAEPFSRASHFWFPHPVHPEVLVQALINVLCLLIAGLMTTRIYQASSRYQLLTPLVYPLLLAVCAATYVMHTVQNFRFIYDLPSLAFFSVAMYLIYCRKHWAWFVLLFMVATINRETTLLLLPLYMIDSTVVEGRLRWQRLLQWRTMAVVVPLAVYWAVWQVAVRWWFIGNRSEFYPRLDWNVKSLLVPQAWPQLLSACGYLLLFVLLMYRRIPDGRLRAWIAIVPLWVAFMFSYGILVETRVFGELIPLTVCSTALILEELLVARVRKGTSLGEVDVASPLYQTQVLGVAEDQRDRAAA